MIVQVAMPIDNPRILIREKALCLRRFRQAIFR
jgi:hypothetical protein